MSKSFANDFLKDFEELILPQELSERFNTLQCLAQNEYGETFLLSEKNGGKRFVLKCYKKYNDMNSVHEAEILRSLEHKALPQYDSEVETDDVLYILRDYIEGVTLEQYLSEHQTDETQAINIIMKLCEILSYLHSQPAPIIHRDIKPTNIIIDPQDKKVTLIDFGISRKYSENADTDTACFGTHIFAPPEQFGFSQTDCRADIYALGVVLRYMLTKSTDSKIKVKNKSLERIVSKCTAFSPDGRYQNAELLRKSLVIHKSRVKQKILFTVSYILVAFIMFVGGFSVGRFTGFMHVEPTDPNQVAVVFVEPLIEDAVRAVLGKEENQQILQGELKNVTELYIVGESVAATIAEWNQLTSTFVAETKPHGTLKNLGDISKMENISSLWIMAQPLSDLSPLESNIRLISVTLNNCNVSDVSPLANLPLLRELELFDNLITEFSIFSKMKSLKTLGVGNSLLYNVSELGDIRRIEHLNLHCSRITSLDGIEKSTQLKVLSIAETLVRDFSPLDELLYLESITISRDMEQYLTTLKRSDVEVVIVD